MIRSPFNSIPAGYCQLSRTVRRRQRTAFTATQKIETPPCDQEKIVRNVSPRLKQA
jgi:hypothetical protein